MGKITIITEIDYGGIVSYSEPQIKTKIVYGFEEYYPEPKKIMDNLRLYISLDESFAIVVNENDDVLFELKAYNGCDWATIEEISENDDD